MSEDRMNIEVKDVKSVWVAWTNTDTTEGRGWIVPLAVCETEATARRLGKRGSVQGCDCEVSEEKAMRIGRYWYAPSQITPSTREDDAEQIRINARNTAKVKAIAAGLTPDDIAALR